MGTIVSAARKELAALDDKRDKLLKIIALAESLDNATEEPAREATRKPGVRQPLPVTVQTRETVRAILEERGAPVKLSDLLPEILSRGIEVGGKKPVATLAARLSNAAEFRSVRGCGWWFADRPLPNTLGVFDEPEGEPSTDAPSGSNQRQGGSDAATLAE